MGHQNPWAAFPSSASQDGAVTVPFPGSCVPSSVLSVELCLSDDQLCLSDDQLCWSWQKRGPGRESSELGCRLGGRSAPLLCCSRRDCSPVPAAPPFEASWGKRRSSAARVP